VSEPLVARLAGHNVPYVLERSVRRRRAVLNVDEYGLTVHVPWRANRTAIERFMQDSAAWILKKLEEWSRFPPRRQRWLHGESIEYVGQSLRLELLIGGAVARARLAVPGRLQICLPALSEAAARAAAVNWYRRHARLNFQSRLAHFVEVMRVRTPRLILSSARTRWGSCNSNGEVRLNWRLIQAPQTVIDYVVVHELSHIREMNHSRRFWRIVEQACPEHALARAHLEERGRWYLAV
jgi:predicted metal-dependent hydrolase